ncbi:MAG: hypothetical protein JWR46_2949, partial [Mycobacterium sp.]|nr:hypothetical protein [Mycobacterium sp.]
MTTGVLLTPNRSAEHIVDDAVERASLAYGA